jgi:hypothetical protein
MPDETHHATAIGPDGVFFHTFFTQKIFDHSEMNFFPFKNGGLLRDIKIRHNHIITVLTHH